MKWDTLRKDPTLAVGENKEDFNNIVSKFILENELLHVSDGMKLLWHLENLDPPLQWTSQVLLDRLQVCYDYLALMPRNTNEDINSRIPRDEMRWKGIVLRYAYRGYKNTFNCEGKKVQDFSLSALVQYLDKLRENASEKEKTVFGAYQGKEALYFPEFKEVYEEGRRADFRTERDKRWASRNTVSPWTDPDEMKAFIDAKLIEFKLDCTASESAFCIDMVEKRLIGKDYDRKEQENVDVWAMANESQSDESHADSSSETSPKWWKDYQEDRLHRWNIINPVSCWPAKQDVMLKCDKVIWKIGATREAHRQPFSVSQAAAWETKLILLIKLDMEKESESLGLLEADVKPQAAAVAVLKLEEEKKMETGKYARHERDQFGTMTGKRKFDKVDTTDVSYTFHDG
jgi:hypothetical protein